MSEYGYTMSTFNNQMQTGIYQFVDSGKADLLAIAGYLGSSHNTSMRLELVKMCTVLIPPDDS